MEDNCTLRGKLKEQITRMWSVIKFESSTSELIISKESLKMIKSINQDDVNVFRVGVPKICLRLRLSNTERNSWIG